MNADQHVHLELAPLNGSPFTIDYAGDLAEFFFRANPSSVGANAYDERVLKGIEPNRITPSDVTAVNQTMAARTPYRHWKVFTDAVVGESWLTALDPGWDLYAMAEKEWLQDDVHEHLGVAFKAIIGPYRRPAVATKVLHIKRPRLIPVCDSYVARSMGVELWDSAGLLGLVTHLREQGRVNLDGLLEIQARLREIGIERTLVRILDALLWMRGNERGEYVVFEQWLHEVYD